MSLIIDVGDMVQLYGIVVPAIENGVPVDPAATPADLVTVLIARESAPSDVTRLTANPSAGSWSISWTPTTSGVHYLRAEASVAGTVVHAEFSTIYVREQLVA